VLSATVKIIEAYGYLLAIFLLAPIIANIFIFLQLSGNFLASPARRSGRTEAGALGENSYLVI
jgi:hypothetical protein